MKNFQLAKLQCPNVPWCQDEPDLLGPAIMEFVLDQESFRRRWCQKWFENINFIYGNQSVKWSQRYDFAVDVDFLRRESPMAQRSQTNIARTVLEALAALIYGDLPAWDADTADESSMKGKRFKKIAEKLLDAYMTKLLMDKELFNAAVMFCAFGQMAAKIDWDPNSGHNLSIPQWEKGRAPVYSTGMVNNPYLGGLLEVPQSAMDSQGQPLYQQRWEPIVDANGQQIVKKMRAGDVRVQMLTPFEYMREAGSHGMHKTKWVEHIRLLDYDDYLSEYENEGGRTKHFKSVLPAQSNSVIHSFAVRHFMRLQYVTPPSLMDSNRRSETILKGSLFKHKVLVIEHYDRPNEKWPEGRKVVVVNGRCTNVSQTSYQTNKLDGWHPFVEAQWLVVAPSSIATGPLNDVIAKNKETNVKDSLIATSLRRNMGSITLLKTGAGLDPQKFSGEPGQIMETNDPENAVRFVTDQNAIPAVIATLKNMDKEEIYEVSGAMDAIRGDRSKGVSSGYALRQLEEREQRRLTPARRQFEYFTSGIGEKVLSCLKANCIELDQNVMGYLQRSAAGEFKPQDVVAFISTPMDYGIDIKVTRDSMAIKSKASNQATLQELAKGPLGQRLQQDAGTLDTYLKFFDAETLRDGSAVHRDRATRENEVFMDYARLGHNAEGINLPIVIFEDDDNIHIDSHTKFLLENSEDLLQNEDLLRVILMHNEQHRIQQKEKTGEVSPGSTAQVPAMMAQARQQQVKPLPMIYYDTQKKQQQQQQQTQQAEIDQQVNVQSKRQQAVGGQPNAPMMAQQGPGGGQVDPNAPSQNTPQAKANPSVQGGQS